MAQSAWFLDDVLDGKLQQAIPTGGFTDSGPLANASKDSPGLQAIVKEGPTVADGWFEIGSSNEWIDVDEGSGEVNVDLQHGAYPGGAFVAAIIEARLNAHASLSYTYSVAWSFGAFVISSASGNFSILWKTGAHGADNANDSIANEIGFSTAADDTGASLYTADKARWSTTVGLHFDLGAASELHGFLWYAEGGDDGPAVDFDDVKVYVDTAFRGWHRDAWEDASSTAITLTARPSDATTTINQIQIGFQDPDTASSYRYGFVSWRHFDESSDHRVGLCKAFKATLDETNGRTIGPLRAHLPIQAAPPRSMSNYYAPHGILRWRATMQFDQWESASWKNVILKIAEHGRQTGLLWVEDFETLKAATAATVQADIVQGLALWGTVHELGGGDASGQQDAYRSGQATIEQLR